MPNPPVRTIRNVQPPPNPIKPGESRARKSGATAELALAPLREYHVAELRRDYPNLDDRRLSLLADRLARIDLASRWLDEQDSIVRDKRGRVYDVVDRLEKWSSVAERVLAEVGREHRQARRFDLARKLSALPEEGSDGA
ncbi:MAG: hypothetical protein WDZ37_05505 [Solirubrobacterales bacterium]